MSEPLFRQLFFEHVAIHFEVFSFLSFIMQILYFWYMYIKDGFILWTRHVSTNSVLVARMIKPPAQMQLLWLHRKRRKLTEQAYVCFLKNCITAALLYNLVREHRRIHPFLVFTSMRKLFCWYRFLEWDCFHFRV